MKKKHPTKKHTTKKHLTKKYFTKAFVKTHIIPISAIGILVGATAITLGVYFGVTSGKSNPPTPPEPGPIPPDAEIIDSSIDNKYIVQNGQVIHSSSTTSIGVHNKLLDLESYAADKGINTSDFVINGEVDFGILVGFNESVNLFGYPQSLISLGTKDNPLATNVYGIIVGKTSAPTASEGVYHGEMHINSSVNVLANTTNFINGIYFGIVDGANITVDGIFTMNSSSLSYTSHGVRFSSSVSGNSTINIGGVFMIHSGGWGNGIGFSNSVTFSDINIDGVFMIYTTNNHSHGVNFDGIVDESNINIKGTFTLSSSANSTVCGVYFGQGISQTGINIGGVFMITSQNETMSGVDFESSISEDTTLDIDGMFAFYSPSLGTYVYSYGVFIHGSTISANWNPISHPQFFSFKTDSGNLRSRFSNAQYKWNGIQINSSTSTTPDDDLRIKPIVAQDNSDFSINVIETTLRQPGNDYNQNIFNHAYQNGLSNYLNTHSACSENVKGWLQEIINQIPFK